MKTNKELLIGLGVGFIFSVLISILFVSPVLKGKVLKQFDITQYKGSAQEVKTYEEKGEKILWTNSMFSGMPAYIVSTRYSGNIFNAIHSAAKNTLPHPAGLIFLLMVNFFVLLIAMKSNPWTALAGAVAFAFSTYFIVILAAGHNAKVDAVAWLPGILAGLYVAYRRNLWVGAAMFGFYLVIELYAGHPQMAFYFSFLGVAFVITEAIGLIIEGKFLHFVKASVLIGVMAVLAIGSNWSYLKTTNDYSKYSIRGKSELTSGGEDKTEGLDRSYVTMWSNGISETWTFVVPNFKGGASDDISKNSTATGAVSGKEKQMLKGVNAYWGDQPSSGGPVYIGAGVFLLFLLALFFVKDRLKWPLLIASLFTILMSWGSNVPKFTNFMLDKFPLYNKFRAVASALIIPELVLPALAFLFVAYIFANPDFGKKKATIFGYELSLSNQSVFFMITGILTFILIVFYIMPGAVNTFFSAGEYDEIMASLKSMGANDTQASDYLNVIETARIAVFKYDVLRSLLFVLLTGGLVWGYMRFNFNKYILAVVLLLITFSDMFSVGKRYLDASNFEDAKTATFRKTTADDAILRDSDINYRVANLSTSTFSDATTSYFHKSIGGYHGAKLKKYQELIEFGITPELERLFAVLGGKPTQEQVENLMMNLQVLNMLNTKYFILNPNTPPLQNPYVNGNAWFPSEIKWVDNADAEMAELQKINTRNTAVADKKFEAAIGGVSLGKDSVSTIKQIAYHPEKMEYESNAATEKVAVFSEIWYPESWVCTIDGNEVPIGRVNYILRAVKVPAGKHKIEFSFNSRFKSDEKISLGFSILLLLILLGLVGKEAYPYFKKNSDTFKSK